MAVLAIDPGPEQAAFCTLASDYRPIQFGKLPNDQLITHLLLSAELPDTIAIEWIQSYSSAPSQHLLHTARWAGRFEQFLVDEHARAVQLVLRKEVMLHLTGQRNVNDMVVRRALIDRFAPFTPNHGKGLKGNPGFFYGFKSDCWQAFAVGVTVLDRMFEEGRAAVLSAGERVGVLENEPPF